MPRNLIALLLAILTCLPACHSSPPETIISDVASQDQINKGAKLAQGFAACGACHSPSPSIESPLSGGRQILINHVQVSGSNLTDIVNSRYSTTQFVAALRESINVDEEPIIPPAHAGYEWIATGDAIAIAAFIRTQPRTTDTQALPVVKEDTDTVDLSALQKSVTEIFSSRVPAPKGFVPSISNRVPQARGAYIVDNLARCIVCHNSPAPVLGSEEYLAGGKEVTVLGQTRIAPALRNLSTQSGKKWNEQQIIDFLNNGVTPSSKVVNPNFCPINFYKNARVEDMQAVARYITSLGN